MSSDDFENLEEVNRKAKIAKGRPRMRMRAIKGFVENGKIRLADGVSLPENAEVFVIVAEMSEPVLARIHTPRLANPLQANDFRKQVLEIPRNAGL